MEHPCIFDVEVVSIQARIDALLGCRRFHDGMA